MAASPSSRQIVPAGGGPSWSRCVGFARALAPLAAIALHGPPASPGRRCSRPRTRRGSRRRAAAAVAAGRPSRRAAWFRLDAVLDEAGTLAGRRLIAGPGRWRDTAARPAGGVVRHRARPGVVLVGDDDGTRSRLSRDRRRPRLRDDAPRWRRRSSGQRRARRTSAALVEHRVDRATPRGPRRLAARAARWARLAARRARLGGRRALRADVHDGAPLGARRAARRDLVWRARVPDTPRRSGAPGTWSTGPTGPVLGCADGGVIAYEACGGFPCRSSAVEPGGRAAVPRRRRRAGRARRRTASCTTHDGPGATRPPDRVGRRRWRRGRAAARRRRLDGPAGVDRPRSSVPSRPRAASTAPAVRGSVPPGRPARRGGAAMSRRPGSLGAARRRPRSPPFP